MFETVLAYALVGLFLMVMAFAILVVGWMMLQALRFNLIVMDIHASASTWPHAHIFPMANFFDAKVLNHREKLQREEGFEILGRLLPTAFVFGCCVALLVMIVSPG